MPACVFLEQDLGPVSGPTILAEREEDSGFIRHVALLLPRSESQIVELIDQASPRAYHVRAYHVSDNLEYNSEFEVHALAWFDDQGVEVLYDHLNRLRGEPDGNASTISKSVNTKRKELVEALRTATEDALIRGVDWIADPPHPPITHPPIQSREDNQTGVESKLELSCVGFVLWCFGQYVGCMLLQTDSMPEIEEPVGDYLVNTVYELPANRLGEAGLEAWPKRLVLPGYILHALKNGAAFPYEPKNFDEAFFPNRN